MVFLFLDDITMTLMLLGTCHWSGDLLLDRGHMYGLEVLG